MKLFFFDLETTGTNPAKHGIHQISGEIVIDGEVAERFDFYVCPNPKAQIDPEALKVAGVTEEQILAYPPMKEVYDQLIALLSKYVNRYDRSDKFYLVGYNNTSFDNPFLRGFFLQNGDSYFGSWFWANSIDVMVLATQFLLEERPHMENFKLSTVARQLGIEVDAADLHSADYDIALTRAIYEHCVKR
ncbi:MAG: 3'-5' exonuclease [Bacteroidaceae bacterium]|nr:3'-5' exonuclease [Bacteroidaceae bacterium]